MSRKIKHIIAKIIRVIGYLVVGAIYASFLAIFVLWVMLDPLQVLLGLIGYIVLIIFVTLTYYGFVALLDWLEK